MELRRRPVSEIMRRDIAVLAPKERLDLTQDIMNIGRVRHMPVLDDGRLVGVISNRDLLAAALSKALDFDAASRRSFLHSVEVEEVMTKEVVTVGPDTTLEEAARMLVRRKIGCLPVVRPDGTMSGLVTETDLLSAAFLDGEGAEEEGRTTDVSTSSEFWDWIKREVEDLRGMRDELRVQAHLAKAEVRDRWEALDRKLEALESRAKRTTRALEQPLQELEKDARKLAQDLREGYRRFRDSI
jgi:CBS domain-containing membrane protein